MFVSVGASKALMKDERQKFLEEEWPKSTPPSSAWIVSS